MNIFVTDPDPNLSAEVLPDKHIVKMPLETCQMLAVVFSKWYYDWGNDLLPKKDGTPYNTEKGAFRGHPCTIWAAESIANTAWLIQHGFGLLEEYTHRYGKVHSCQTAMNAAEKVFEEKTGRHYYATEKQHHSHSQVPDVFKYDTSIDTLTAYKRYIIVQTLGCI
jgi:hypothetical protein